MMSRRAYIGTNNTKAGEAAGKAAAQVRPRRGFGGGVRRHGVGLERDRTPRTVSTTGAGEKFIKPPLETFEDGADLNKAQTFAQTAITKHPDAGVFLGLYSYNGPRIAEEDVEESLISGRK